MQKIRSILKIGNSGAELCDNYGSSVGVTLELMLGTAYLLEFELRRDAAGESAVLPDYSAEELNAASCYCAFDFSCQNSDDPPLLITTGVKMQTDASGKTVFSVPLLNSATERITSVLKSRMETELFCELGGFDSSGKPVFAWQFTVTLRSRIYLGGGNESVAGDPEYYTAVQVEAIVSGLSAEIARVGNETSGLSAEIARVGNETYGLSAEIARVGNETSGLSAEIARVGNETSGLSAEIARVGNETSGLSAEIARVEAMIPEEKEVTAAALAVNDSADYFTGETVEAVLQEIGSRLDGVEDILGGI